MPKFLLSLAFLFLPAFLLSQSNLVDSLQGDIKRFEAAQDSFRWARAWYALHEHYNTTEQEEKADSIQAGLDTLYYNYGFRVDDLTPEEHKNLIAFELYFQLKVLENADPGWGFETVKNKAFDFNDTYPNLNPDTVHWMKFTVYGSNEGPGNYIFQASSSVRAWKDVDIYVVKPDSLVHLKSGFRLLNKDKNLRGYANLFELSLQKAEKAEVYIRVSGKDPDFPATQLQMFFYPHMTRATAGAYTFDGIYPYRHRFGNPYTAAYQQLDFFPDSLAQLSLEEVKEQFDEKSFGNGGWHFDPEMVYWGRIKILGTENFFGDHLFAIGTNGSGWGKVDVYYQDAKGEEAYLKTGSKLLFYKKYRKHPLNLIELSVRPNELTEVYFRFDRKNIAFQEINPTQLLYIAHYDRNAFWDTFPIPLLRFGVLLGATVISFCFFILFLGFERTRLSLYFSLVAFGFILIHISVGDFTLFSPATYTGRFFAVFSGLFLTFSVYLFTFEYLNLKGLGIRFRWFSTYLLPFSFLPFLFQVFKYNPPSIVQNSMNVLFLVLILTFAINAVISLRRGHKPARFYLMAFSGLFLFFLSFNIDVLLGLRAFSVDQFIVYFQAATLIVLFFFAMGMGYRFRLQQKERAHALSQKKIALAQAQAAQDASETKSNFLNTVSHELRTPLTSIIGFTKLNKKNLEEKVLPKLQDADGKTLKNLARIGSNLDVVGSESNRLLKLINELLDLAKIESGKIDWKEENIHVANLIERATLATTALFKQKPQLKLITEVPEDLPDLIGDSDRLLQVLLNLISNAVKFTDSGSVTIGVRTGMLENRNQVLGKPSQLLNRGQPAQLLNFFVSDTGSGIPTDHLDKVFERFQQVDSAQSGKPKGTGLGLPICKEIVEHHGGEIWVESEEGQGSTFSFSIPLKNP